MLTLPLDISRTDNTGTCRCDNHQEGNFKYRFIERAPFHIFTGV